MFQIGGNFSKYSITPFMFNYYFILSIFPFLSFFVVFCFKLGEKRDFCFLFVLSFPLPLFLLLLPPPTHLPYLIFRI